MNWPISIKSPRREWTGQSASRAQEGNELTNPHLILIVAVCFINYFTIVDTVPTWLFYTYVWRQINDLLLLLLLLRNELTNQHQVASITQEGNELTNQRCLFKRCICKTVQMQIFNLYFAALLLENIGKTFQNSLPQKIGILQNICSRNKIHYISSFFYVIVSLFLNTHCCCFCTFL